MSLPGVSGHTAEVAKEAAVLQLINAYRVRGHLIADLDPLGGEPATIPNSIRCAYGLTIWDLDREFLTGTLGEASAKARRRSGDAAGNSGDAAADVLRQRSDAST